MAVRRRYPVTGFRQVGNDGENDCAAAYSRGESIFVVWVRQGLKRLRIRLHMPFKGY